MTRTWDVALLTVKFKELFLQCRLEPREQKVYKKQDIKNKGSTDFQSDLSPFTFLLTFFPSSFSFSIHFLAWKQKQSTKQPKITHQTTNIHLSSAPLLIFFPLNFTMTPRKSHSGKTLQLFTSLFFLLVFQNKGVGLTALAKLTTKHNCENFSVDFQLFR